MKMSLKYILLLLVSGVFVSGCLPDPAEEALKYNGPTVVEFKNHTIGMVATAAVGLDYRGILSTTSAAQTDSSRFVSIVGYTIPATATTAERIIRPRVADTVHVQLVGPQRSIATNVRFEIISGSTAVEGTHFTLEPANAKTVTIPANSSVGYLIVKPIASGYTGTERKTVGFRLLGSDDASANPNYDTFYVTMTNTR
jgi:hypothetical protein